MADLTQPTLAGYILFIRGVMGINTTVLPDASPAIEFSYVVAQDWASRQLRRVRSSSPLFPSLYALAVYNLAGDRLVNYAADVDNTPVEGGDLPYFANLRATYKLNAFVGGVVNSTSDEGTSVGLTVPEAMSGLTFDNLQRMKTPWGREYLGIAQSLGPSVWGLS